MGDYGMQSAVQAPLGVKTRRVGHIRLMSRDPSAYSKLSLELLDKVPAYVTPAVQNALEHRQAVELACERERNIDLDARTRELERLPTAENPFIATVSPGPQTADHRTARPYSEDSASIVEVHRGSPVCAHKQLSPGFTSRVQKDKLLRRNDAIIRQGAAQSQNSDSDAQKKGNHGFPGVISPL